MSTLFGPPAGCAPLADRLRPRRWEDLIGLEGAAGAGTPLGRQLLADALTSTILWGPPGSGKTTVARLIASHTERPFVGLSAVLSTLKEVREVMERARTAWRGEGRPTVLFMDEIHRFNKAQQDAFLPYLEEGSVILLGTTTENPSFHLTPALLSRCRTLVLSPLEEESVLRLLERAAASDLLLKEKGRKIPPAVLLEVARMASGDARFALNALEALALRYPPENELTPKLAREGLSSGRGVYDWGGEEHYNLISAYHKSIRNSDPDAALYWLFRMLEGGEDALYVARRLVRAASEDVGNADPQALRRALDAKEAIDFLGMPEGALALAQATVYLAAAPKSNRVYLAQHAVERDLREGRRYPVPLAIRNSDPDAALYWLFRMLEGGEDALYVARRLVRAASEDVGNADPQALRRALDAKDAIDFLGMPEGALALAQATVYLAAAPKSNRVYLAQHAVERDLREGRRYPVPLAIRNAATKLMKEQGYGEGYRYAHDEEEGVSDLQCLPSELAGRVYYEPKDSGFEARIKEWLGLWKERRARAARAARKEKP